MEGGREEWGIGRKWLPIIRCRQYQGLWEDTIKDRRSAFDLIVGDKAVNAEARATLCDDDELVCERMQDRHTEREREREREREIGTKNKLYSNSNDYKKGNNPFTKGYKVTLYSDSLRATSLYTIYRNSPNLCCTKGQCEYGHCTLVFTTNHPR